MIDLRKTVIPKSDQLNADDLIGQTITIKVTKVSLLEATDQPIAINFESDGGKPYKPCKSMRRVLIHIWGNDGNKFVGRSMTLFRDANVMFGGVATGGIRISHMSDMTVPVTMALTATRASRKPYTVQPLAAPPSPVQNGVPADVLVVRDLGDEAADAGMDALRKFWDGLSKSGKAAVGGAAQLAAWKAIAEAADMPDVDFDNPSSSSSEEAAAGQHSPAERSAAAPATDPAPVPQEPGRASNGAANEAPAIGPAVGDAKASPEGAAPRQGPQSAGQTDAPRSSPAPTERHGPAAAAHPVAARKAEIRKDGDARAAAGTAALASYLEELRKVGEADLVTSTQKTAWYEEARAADAAKGRKG